MIKHPVTTQSSFKPFIIVAVVLCLSACAGTGPTKAFSDDEFSTEITSDGTKFFTYVRHLPKDSKPDKGLREAVATKLETTGFCRDGYLRLENYHANGIARLRGECKEGASTHDREQFPNRQ